MKRGFVTLALMAVSMVSFAQTITTNGVTFMVFYDSEYDIPTYEWYNMEGSDGFYMDGSYPQMTVMIRKMIGDKITHPTKSFYIGEGVHHTEWENIMINGKSAVVSITKNLKDSTVLIYFPNEDGTVEDLLTK